MTDARPAEHANELSKINKTRFCVAFFVFSFAWMLALQIVAAVLLPQRLADIAPDSKDAIFGVLNSATALASLISNLVVGNMSDRTRSIFGRRTPWIASGGIVAGISLFLIGILPDGVSISWYRYNIRKEDEKEKTESQEVIAADRKTVEELQKEQNAVPEAEEAPEIVLDELILSDNNRLVILDYGGGTDASSVEEAVDGFLEPLLKQ